MVGYTSSCNGSRWSIAFLQLVTRGGERILHKLFENCFFKGKMCMVLISSESRREGIPNKVVL